MPVFDIGGAPAEEDCAQLGHTDGFAAINRLEVEAYQAAIIARHGPPPTGCRFRTVRNAHDFGTYLTLGLHLTDADSEGDTAEIEAYFTRVECGLRSWIEAGFTAPVRYDGATPIELRTLDETIVGALLTTRPGPDGTFPVADFATLHGNLAAAYPAQAAVAAARLAG
ncbi:hypothetical protein FHS96_005775 [Sphingomonas zeicaulis]|uniref:hypothetical protein n=1 Tax=Sphingomonas zeicaulis TaxID=1632740 RepID=UPI003D2449B9